MRAKFGLSLSNRAVLFEWTSMEDLLDAAQRAEESGFFHGVWVGDNFLSKPRIDSIVTLSAIAARTQRVKLGTICMASFPLRHPVPLAIQWASLDVLSGGRTILGVCSGGSERLGPAYASELDAMGVASNERIGRLIEGIGMLRKLWSEGRVTHQGKYYSLNDVELLPKPAQSPLPIFIALNPEEGQVDDAIVDRLMRRVGRHGDGWQTDATSPENFRKRFDLIRQHATDEGRDASKLESCLHLMVNINEDRHEALTEAEEFFSLYYGAGTISRENAELWVAHGPPQAVVEKIETYIDAGCTMPVLRFASRNVAAQLERCISEVMPAFQTA